MEDSERFHFLGEYRTDWLMLTPPCIEHKCNKKPRSKSGVNMKNCLQRLFSLHFSGYVPLLPFFQLFQRPLQLLGRLFVTGFSRSIFSAFSASVTGSAFAFDLIEASMPLLPRIIPRDPAPAGP